MHEFSPHHSQPRLRTPRHVAAVPNRTCVRVAVLDPHELTMAGLKSLLTSATDSPFLVVPAVDQGLPPDVVLYSVHSEDETRHDPDLHALLRSTPCTVLATYWDENSPAIEAARACGVHGTLSQRLPGHILLEHIQAIHEGRCPDEHLLPPDGECHPEIARAGLAQRARGAWAHRGGPDQPGDRRSFVPEHQFDQDLCAHRLLEAGIQRRSQAVIWAERHGLNRPRLTPVADREEGAPTA